HRTAQKTREQAGDSEIQAQHDARRGADPNNTPESTRVPAATAFWVSSTYFSEGLPYMIVRILSSVYFTDVGAKERFIGYLNFLGIPWNLKFLWAPFVDAISTKRRWLVLMQLGISVLTMGIAISCWMAPA